MTGDKSGTRRRTVRPSQAPRGTVDNARVTARADEHGTNAAVSRIFFKHFFAPPANTVYLNPDLYDEGVLSNLSRRANLARGVVDVVVGNHHFPGASVLDIGAGTGIFTLELMRRGLLATALDVYAEPLARLSEKAANEGLTKMLNISQSDLNLAFPYEDDSFGTVTSLRATRYIKDFSYFLSEVRRVLMPGGVLVLPVFGVDTISWRRRSNSGMRQTTSTRGIKRAIAMAGLEVNVGLSQKYWKAVDKTLPERDVPFYYKPTIVVAAKATTNPTRETAR